MITLPQLNAHPECTLCPVRDEAAAINPAAVGIPSRWFTRSLPPSPDTPVLFVIGQNPGTQETKVGRCFVGESGEWLENIWLGGVDLHELATIYFGNACRCGPRSITEQQPYNICFQYTIDDMNAIFDFHSAAPKKGVLLVSAKGVPPFFRFVAGQKGVKQKQSFSMNGVELDFGPHRIAVWSTYHPAAVMRSRRLGLAVDGHMNLVRNWLLDQLPTASKPNRIPPRYPHP